VTEQLPAEQESLNQVAQRLDQMIQSFEQHPIVQVRDQVMEMLGLVDTLHRAGLQRVMEIVEGQRTNLLDQMLADPAISLLLALYDLMPPEPCEQVTSALEMLGPYIASYGCSIELLDVIGGEVHLAIDCPRDDIAGAKQKLLQDIEMALRQGYSAFRSLQVHTPDKPSPAGSSNFIPLQQISSLSRTIKRPVFTPVMPVEALSPGSLKGIDLESVRVLLCNIDGDVYAYRNACEGSVLPLDAGQLEGHTLRCPWHNCLYDMRTGKHVDGGTGRLTVIPAAVRDGMIQLALNVEPVTLRVARPGQPGSGGESQ